MEQEFEKLEQVIIMSYTLERFATVLKETKTRLRVAFYDTSGDYVECWRKKTEVKKF